jgi:cytochrome c553
MFTRKLTIVATSVLLAMVANVQAAGSIEKGADITDDCIQCHGVDGKGNFETPAIAGLGEVYILEQLRAFNSKEKKSLDDMMHLYTEDRNDEDFQDLAAYWASQPK